MRMLEEVAGDQQALQTLLESTFGKNKKQYPFRPMKVQATPNCLAIIDSNSCINQASLSYGPLLT